MAPAATPDRAGCPPRAVLASFQGGRLPHPEAESVASHLSGCAGCEAALSDLRGRPDDPLGKLLAECRRAGAASDVLPAELEAVARLAWPPPTDPTTEPSAHPRTDADLEPGAVLGRYQLVAVLGRGGMGVVYRGRHLLTRREVALKTLPRADRPDHLARFRTEAEAVARLDHPNVVRLFDAGEAGGRPFLAMELVEGGTLAGRLGTGPLPPDEAAGLVRTLARAVSYAHGRGVLHRDLKPSNVLLAADGTPKIGDFGLAKLVDGDDRHLTATDSVIGTPAYMAPEQAAGRPQDTGVRTDVYALGVLLYETLCGSPPFWAPTKLETLRLVREAEPLPPDVVRPGVPAAVAAVCLKCLEKSPARRYPSAAALADDLDRWLRGAPPRHTRGRLRRASRWVGRRKAAAAGVVAAAAVAGLGFAAYRADPERPVRAAVGDLAAGQPVVPIDDAGRVPYHRWLEGEAEGKAATADGAFAVQSGGLGLVELLPAVPADRYRLTARVRHVRCDRPGEAGVYVALRTYPGGPVPVRFFVQLTFDDVRAAADIPLVLPAGQPVPRPKNAVRLFPHLFSRPGTPPDLDWRMGSGNGPRFDPAGERKAGWRTLVIDVSPDGVDATWDGQPVKQTAAGLRKAIDATAAGMMPRYPADGFVRGLRPEYDPRGGVGLYVCRGAASFQSVTVTPSPGE